MSFKEDSSEASEAATSMENFQDVNKMSKKDMVEHIEKLRALWSWLPDELKYFISQIGRECVFVDRMNKAYYGTYHGFEVRIDSHKIYNIDVRYDQVTHKPFLETGTINVFASTITNFKFLESRIEREPEVI